MPMFPLALDGAQTMAYLAHPGILDQAQHERALARIRTYQDSDDAEGFDGTD